MITIYAQRNPEWAADLLGAGPETVGQAGCLISSAASMLQDWLYPVDPRGLNRWLTRNLGYVDSNLFLWSILGLIPGVQFVNYVDCARVAAPVTRIAQSLAADCGVLCEVDSTPGGTVQQHWVRVLEATSGNTDFRIMDPWTGTIDLMSKRYFAAGWDAARAIMAVGTYCLASSARMIGDAGPAAPTLTTATQQHLDMLSV